MFLDKWFIMTRNTTLYVINKRVKSSLIKINEFFCFLKLYLMKYLHNEGA